MIDPLPDELDGWKATAGKERYSRDTIFDYIDGAGEIYRQYGFRELEVRRFSKAGEPSIVLEIFDMGSAEDAFGVFTHGRSGDDIGIGSNSEYRQGWLCFWKDRYFLCAYAEGRSEAASQAIVNLGRTVAATIQGESHRPKILQRLPASGLIQKSLRFFHTSASLNYHYFLSDANSLHLSEATDAVLATYGETGKTSLLLLVGYQNEIQAQAAFGNFLDTFMPQGDQTHIQKNEDGSWTAAKMDDTLIAVVLEAPDGETAERLLAAVVVAD